MERGRARDVEEVQRFAIEHQLEVIVDPHVFDQIDSVMAPRGNRIMDRDNADPAPRLPSRQMGIHGDRAKPRNCSTQHHAPLPAAVPAELHCFVIARLPILPDTNTPFRTRLSEREHASTSARLPLHRWQREPPASPEPTSLSASAAWSSRAIWIVSPAKRREKAGCAK